MVTAVLVGFGATRAQAASAVHVQTSGTLPFTEGELEDAVAARVPIAEGAATLEASLVRVRSQGHAVEVEMAGKARTVEVEGLSGKLAARRVAVAVADLAMAELAPAALPAPDWQMHELPAPLVVEHKPEPCGAPVLFLGALPVATWNFFPSTLVGGVVDLSVQTSATVRAVFDLGFQDSLPSQVGGSGATDVAASVPVGIRAMPLRAGVAWQPVSFLQLRVTALVLKYWGLNLPDGVTAGGGAQAVFFIPLGKDLRLEAAGGLDMVSSDTLPVYIPPPHTTPCTLYLRCVTDQTVSLSTLSPWVGLGLAFAIGP